MSELLIHNGEWVVVCDGAKALILENAGDAKFPNLKTSRCSSTRTCRPANSAAERPGRSYSSVGHGRSSYEQTDLHNQAEEAFLTGLVHHLDAAVTAGKTKSVIIVAPPRALGVLRPAYSHSLKSAVRAEIDKDLVKMPVHEIEKYLSGG